MNMVFRNATENEVEILTRMSRESFLSDTAFGGAGGHTGMEYQNKFLSIELM